MSPNSSCFVFPFLSKSVRPNSSFTISLILSSAWETPAWECGSNTKSHQFWTLELSCRLKLLVASAVWSLELSPTFRHSSKVEWGSKAWFSGRALYPTLHSGSNQDSVFHRGQGNLQSPGTAVTWGVLGKLSHAPNWWRSKFV
jgi:hypothetical protein